MLYLFIAIFIIVAAFLVWFMIANHKLNKEFTVLSICKDCIMERRRIH